MNNEVRAHTPPLGHKALTPLYDAAIALLTRERKWRSAFIAAIAPRAGDMIIDIGSGTGSLALALHEISPRAHYNGIDPDIEAVERATAKAERAGSSAKFEVGYFSADAIPFEGSPDKIISSLVLHQVPMAEKRRILNEAFDALKPGGSVRIADYGLQEGIQRALFRLTVQALDGKEDTQPNADGLLPVLLEGAAFLEVAEVTRIATPTGTISIYCAKK